MHAKTALLLLTDARLPAGGHAHSAGVEAFVRSGELHDVASLSVLLDARLQTTAVVDACLAAATTLAAERGPIPWHRLDAEANARITAPPLRSVSRTLGRQLARAAAVLWHDARIAQAAAVDHDGPHVAVAIGAVALAAGLDPHDAALAAAYGALTQPATAAVRLLGLDPYAVHALLAARACRLDELAIHAVALARRRPLGALPAPGAVRSDFAAVRHAHEEVRLFAS